jgi:hypothetical protein
VTCSHALNELFANLAEPLAHIAKIKQLEDAGDELTTDDIDHTAIVLEKIARYRLKRAALV